MTMRNPVFVPTFPSAVDPPLPPTKVADANLHARFDTQIRAIEQAQLAGKSLYGGAFAGIGTFQTLSATPTALSFAAAFGPAASTAFVSSTGIQVLRAQDVVVRAALQFYGTAVTFGLYRNGVLLVDSARATTVATPVEMTIESLVAAQNGDTFAIFASIASGSAVMNYAGSLLVTAAGAGQGLQGPPGAGVTTLVLDKAFADSPVTVPPGNTDVSVDTTGGDVVLNIVNGVTDRETKIFRIRAGSHDAVITSSSANILVQGNPGPQSPWHVSGPANVVELTWIAAANQWQSA